MIIPTVAPKSTSLAANFAKGEDCARHVDPVEKVIIIPGLRFQVSYLWPPLPLPWILDATELKSDFPSTGGIKKKKTKNKKHLRLSFPFSVLRLR